MNLHELIGEGTNLSTTQMAIRASFVFIVALALLRLAGRRAFGMGASFDIVIGILLGAILSRAVVGASPFVPTIIAALVIVALYKLFAWLSVLSGTFGKIVKGDADVLYEHGKLNRSNMKSCLITERDLMASLRLEGNADSLDDVKKVYLERNGRISIIKEKDRNSSDV